LRLRAAIYVRNDSKGRLDIGKNDKLNINIGQINMLLAGADKAIEAARRATGFSIPEKEAQLIQNAEAI